MNQKLKHLSRKFVSIKIILGIFPQQALLSTLRYLRPGLASPLGQQILSREIRWQFHFSEEGPQIKLQQILSKKKITTNSFCFIKTELVIQVLIT